MKNHTRRMIHLLIHTYRRPFFERRGQMLANYLMEKELI